MGEIGYMKNGVSHRKTNFSVNVVGHVLISNESEDDSADSDDEQQNNNIVLEYLVKIRNGDDQSTRWVAVITLWSVCWQSF